MSIEQTKKSENLRWNIRRMRHEDIDRCLEIWREVKLTEAKQTVSSALSADPEGFYVAELEETTEIVGMCAGSMTRSDTAFMGFYAIEPRYQKAGIGRELWARTVGRLDPSINIGLYGVPAMSEKYKKTGFVLEDSIRMLIFESLPNEEDKLRVNALKDIDELHCCHIEKIDANSNELLFKKLVDYDHTVQKFSREKLLRYYLRGDDVPLTLAIVKDNNKSRSCAHPACDQHHLSNIINERKSSCCAKPSQESIFEDETLSTTIKSSLSISPGSSMNTLTNADQLHTKSTSTVDSTTTQDQSQTTNVSSTRSENGFEVLGYGSIRVDNYSGGIIGPIYADSGDLCEVILKNLVSRFSLNKDSIYSVMALSSNKQACKILTKIGLKEIEQCSRMFTKFVPAASLSKVYYVHSPNFTLF